MHARDLNYTFGHLMTAVDTKSGSEDELLALNGELLRRWLANDWPDVESFAEAARAFRRELAAR